MLKRTDTEADRTASYHAAVSELRTAIGHLFGLWEVTDLRKLSVHEVQRATAQVERVLKALRP